ncbi:MAG: GNAT family N-acetyltransferase [Magnetococcales bacterium]|nr:GNAT family N-acetyltransferase [Magnetococcales bacterium]
MQFVCYSTWDQLPESADALFAKAEQESLFLSRAWFETLAETVLARDQTLFLACVVDDGSVLAILPLMARPDGNCEALSNHVTPLYSLLIAEKNAKETFSCLVGGLSRLPNRIHRFLPIDANDHNMNRLQQKMESVGFECRRYFRIYNWVHEMQECSFEQYMAGRPALLRHTIARKSRKLEREHGYHIRLFVQDDLQQAISDYQTVFRASWQGTEHFADFIPNLVNRLAERGWLRLAILYIGRRPAAAQLWFVAHRRASIFRLAYDKSWKSYSPGSILTRYLMEQAIDVDKVKEIDFLTGNDPYKRDWMSQCRKRWVLGCGNRRKPQSPLARLLASLKKRQLRFQTRWTEFRSA